VAFDDRIIAVSARQYLILSVKYFSYSSIRKVSIHGTEISRIPLRAISSGISRFRRLLVLKMILSTASFSSVLMTDLLLLYFVKRTWRACQIGKTDFWKLQKFWIPFILFACI